MSSPLQDREWEGNTNRLFNVSSDWWLGWALYAFLGMFLARECVVHGGVIVQPRS